MPDPRHYRARPVEAGERVVPVVWYSQGYPTRIHLWRLAISFERRALCGKALPMTARAVTRDDDDRRGRCGPCDQVFRRFQLTESKP